MTADPSTTASPTVEATEQEVARHVALFTTRAAVFTAVLDGVDGDWDAPTPCDGWTVRDVVDHVVGTERDFLDRQGIPTGEAPPTGADASTVWREHLSVVTAALSADGVAARRYDGWFGPTTVAGTMADFYGWDLVVHSWDVARATSQDWSVDEEEARALSRAADGWGDALHSEGICGAPVDVPEDAPEQDRLLARLGRDPRWSRRR